MDTATLLLLFVGLVCLGILVWAGRRRFPLRIGLGNFFRRKTQVAIGVAGLLIGTAIISSSYVIQSTFDYTIRSAVFRNLDHIDELVFVSTPDGRRSSFSISVFDELDANRGDMPNVDGLAPRHQLPVSVVNNDSGLFEPSANAIGFDPALDLGAFVRPANGPLPTPATIGAIVQDAGRGAFNDAANLFVPLGVLQAVLGQPGTINLIAVSNRGGITDGYLVSDDP